MSWYITIVIVGMLQFIALYVAKIAGEMKIENPGGAEAVVSWWVAVLFTACAYGVLWVGS